MAEVYALRVRIKFSKFDTMRFIGHLDVMRYFQRLFRRTGLPIKYTEGYHPHQILSFAQPLGLGLTSDGEYLDTEFTEELPLDHILEKMREALSHGFDIISAEKLADREVNKKLVTSMSLISRAVYLLILKDDENRPELSIPYEDIGKLLAKEKLNIIKKTKKGEKELDLKEYIYEIYYSDDGLDSYKEIYVSKNSTPVVNSELVKNGKLHAPEFKSGQYLIVSLSAGSETNISPDLFLESVLGETELTKNDFRIHRVELYGGTPEESVPLCLIP